MNARALLSFVAALFISITMMSLIAAATSSAHAEGDVTATVRYSAREASTTLGAQRLYKRLQAASRAVCEPYRSRELAKLALYNTCYQHALADAVANVNLASLRTLHNEHTVRVADRGAVTKPAG